MDSPDRPGLTAEELETTGRLVLAELPVALRAGSWWGYHPAEATVTYPAGVLSEWSAERLVAALSHEAGEARFTGPEGGRLVAAWVERLAARGLGHSTLTLLVNVINDMRVNRLQMARYPGARRVFAELYRENPDLEPKTDERRSPADEPEQPFHHQYLDGLIQGWSEREWPQDRKAPKLVPMVRRALQRTSDAVASAAQKDAIADLLEAVEVHVLPTYARLVRDWREGQRPPHPDAPRQAAPDASDPGQRVADEAEAPQAPDVEPDTPGQAGATPAKEGQEDPAPQPDDEVAPEQGGEQQDGAPRAADVRRKQRADPSAPPREIQQGPRRVRSAIRDQVMSSSGDTWHPALIAATRTEDQEPRVDYEKFDYLASVRRLEALIRESIYGDSRRPGLADIMNRRRHGTVDPWRRPRKQRQGDSGEIDLEHPDRLVTAPDRAFLKGVRVPRADRQRDFADAILLDISGSMVQRGFPTRKFDRLVEAAVLFIEIHERLKIPYEVLSFSTEPHVHWAFDRCQWTSTRIDSIGRYTPKDHSEIFRRMYRLDHRDTDDAGAVRAASRDALKQRGLKSLLVVTDGISSDPAALRRVLSDIERRNRNAPEEQRLRVLAFGVGVVRSEFESAYVPREAGKALRSCSGVVIEDTAELPRLIRDAVDQRIRLA